MSRDEELAAAQVARARTQKAVEDQRAGPLARMAAYMAGVREVNHLAASIRLTFDPPRREDRTP